MGAGDEIARVLRDLQYAITVATGRIGEMGLKVSEVQADIKTVLSTEGGVELDLKVVKVGGGVSTERTHTVSVVFAPTPVAPAEGLEGKVVDALEVIEAAIASLDERFTVSSASAEIGFTTSAEGKISIVVGGGAERAETHTAKLKLVPA